MCLLAAHSTDDRLFSAVLRRAFVPRAAHASEFGLMRMRTSILALESAPQDGAQFGIHKLT